MSQGSQQPSPESLAPSSGPRASPQAHLLPHSPGTADVRTSRVQQTMLLEEPLGMVRTQKLCRPPRGKQSKGPRGNACMCTHLQVDALITRARARITCKSACTHTCRSPCTRVCTKAPTEHSAPQAPVHPHHTYPCVSGVIRTLHKHICAPYTRTEQRHTRHVFVQKAQTCTNIYVHTHTRS